MSRSLALTGPLLQGPWLLRSLTVWMALVMGLLAGLPAAQAQAPRRDIAGSRDHPLVGRYDGATIAFSKLRDYEEMRLPVAPVRGRAELTPENSVALSGRALRLLYRGPVDRSSLEVVRNHQQRLEAQGFETIFTCRTRDCGGSDLWFSVTNQLKGSGLPPNWENQTYLIARLRRPQGDVHVALLSVEQGNEVRTLVDVVEAKAMETDKIKVLDAGALKNALDRDGRAVLYGIEFEFDKAVITPTSAGQIAEIAKFLKSTPGLSVVVAGHTDSKGGFDYNLDLSRRRAQAVVQVLTRDGIAAVRLTAFGAGMAAPVASNDDEAGRARNRRVEIVKR